LRDARTCRDPGREAPTGPGGEGDTEIKGGGERAVQGKGALPGAGAGIADLAPEDQKTENCRLFAGAYISLTLE